MFDSVAVHRHLEERLPEGLAMLERMVGINSYTGNPAGVSQLARYTADCFAPLGFTAESVPSTCPNYADHLVLTRRGTGNRSLAMIAHLDTVFPPEEEQRNNFRWQPEGDRIYGPGTEDIKGGTIMMWLVLSVLQKLSPEVFDSVHWKLFWNSSEEQFSPDFGDVCRARMDHQTMAALVFEAEGHSNGQRRLVLARKGRGTFRITARGRGAHAGGDHAKGANAIEQLSRCIQQVSSLTDYARQLTFNVGRISGGIGLNRIPHEAVAEGEFRAFSPQVYTAAKSALLALNGRGSVTSPHDGWRTEVITEILTESRPWPRNPATDRLFSFWQEAAQELNIATGYEERGGLSDGNSLWDAVPTLDGLGPSGDNSHSSERSSDGSKLPEYVIVSSFVPKAMLNVNAILRLLAAG